ncbi:phosphonate C-P lyase system protein PhnL [Thalassobaculum litoreum]|uniref:Alpha-D-ribose 1-methylphosphonate 5-triphosphate synthase subunit PhnL n=1 Tax=Thalassobaculum litoreum DSM 18839 TaxID=1123362 RepID=A0A8G2BDW1_9PROT|nr:phosphonate C-P lyase system protein PhnL [Thalassobaculum litoreum]SDF07512.1 alpha-D-ribose 1-methylphosphonate 5-triphosphate synthase subunit PhnL [Thalassobaculum litoreum DSM 18839]
MTQFDDTVMLHAQGLSKHFVLHNQGGVKIDVFEKVEFTARQGECVILAGPSGSGKSTLLRSLYANYKPQAGSIYVRHGEAWVDLCAARPFQIMEVRRDTLGYVSQFLRVIPRVATLDLVSEPLIGQGLTEEAARKRAETILARLRIPEALWSLPPSTFSGGEQQRVNIAMTFVQDYPILLLDEPTASLDKDNRETVIALINEAKGRGAAIIGIFHDAEVRAAVGTRSYDVTEARQAA